MTLHPPKKHETRTPESYRRSTRIAPPLTIGHILRADWEKKKAERARRAELAEMGFKPLEGA